jgi:hypothetical protein
MAGTRAKARKMQAAYGTGGHCCHAQSDKVRLLMVQTFIYSAVMYQRGDTTKAVKTRSAVVKLSSILALHPRDCSSDVLRGHWATSTRCTH